MTRKKMQRGAQSEALAAALDLAGQGVPVDDPRVRVAAMLTPATTMIRESSRAAVKESMLDAYDAAGTDSSQVTDLTDMEPYTARIDLTDGGVVRLADVEHIGKDRALSVAHNVVSLSQPAQGARQ